MKNEVQKPNQTPFEQIREVDDFGNEFWGARKLSKILEYAEFRNFLPVIERAKEACNNSGQPISDHFVDYHEMVAIGSGAERSVEKLKREQTKGKTNAHKAHFEVGQIVRQTIKEIGGTMPEKLPVADSIKKIEHAQKPKPLNAPKKKK